jgi:hypothetical protein
LRDTCRCCRAGSRILGSAASTIDPGPARSYFGGSPLRSARRTVFFETPTVRAIALIGIFSARCSRRISAQFSTVITSLSSVTSRDRRGQFSRCLGVSFHPMPTGAPLIVRATDKGATIDGQEKWERVG